MHGANADGRYRNTGIARNVNVGDGSGIGRRIFVDHKSQMEEGRITRRAEYRIDHWPESVSAAYG